MRLHWEGSLAFPWPPYEISAVSKTSNLPWHPFQRERYSLITTQAEIIKPPLCSPEFLYLEKESEREDAGVRLCCARTFAWQCPLIDPSLSWHSCPARSESSWMTEVPVKRSEATLTLSRLHLWWEIMCWSVTCSPISDRVSCVSCLPLRLSPPDKLFKESASRNTSGNHDSEEEYFHGQSTVLTW